MIFIFPLFCIPLHFLLPISFPSTYIYYPTLALYDYNFVVLVFPFQLPRAPLLLSLYLNRFLLSPSAFPSLAYCCTLRVEAEATSERLVPIKQPTR